MIDRRRHRVAAMSVAGLLAVGLVLVVVVTGLVPLSGARAGAPEQARPAVRVGGSAAVSTAGRVQENTRPTALVPGVGVGVTGISPTELTPGGSMTLSAVVEGTTSVGEFEIVVSRTRDRTVTSSALARWLSSGTVGDERPESGQPLVDLARVPVDLAPDGGPVPLTVTLTAEQVGLAASLAASGPYGLRVDAVRTGTAPDPDRPGDARGFLVWSPPTGAQPTELLTVVPIAGPLPDPVTGLVPQETLAAETSASGRLRRVLDLAGTLDATWAVDPMLVASAADAAGVLTPDVGGPGPLVRPAVTVQEPTGAPPMLAVGTPPEGSEDDGAPTSPPDDDTDPDQTLVERWLADLASRRGDRDVLSTGWTWPDLGRVAVAPDPTAARGAAERVEAATLAPSVLERLLDGPVRVDVPLLPAGSADAAALVAAPPGTAGFVIAEADLPRQDPLALTYTPDAVASVTGPVGDVRAVLADTRLSAALGRAAEGDALARTEVVAVLAATAVQRPSDARLLAAVLPADVSPVPTGTAALAETLAATPWAQPVTLGAALDTEVPAVERRPGSEDGTPQTADPAVVEDLMTSLEEVRGLAAAFEDTRDRRLAADVRVSTALSSLSPVEEIGEQARALTGRATAATSDVRLVPGSRVTLATREAPLRFTVVNELSSPVELVLHVDPANRRVVVREPETLVRLEPGVRTTVLVPVTAVGSGAVTVRTELRTSAGNPWGRPVDLEVNVATLVQSRALLAAALVVGVVFVVGAARAVRVNRRRAELEEQE